MTEQLVLTSAAGYTRIRHTNFKECHPRCVGKLDRWVGSQKHNSCNI